MKRSTKKSKLRDKKSKKHKKTKLTPEQRKAAAKARQRARLGDGSFPDILVVQKEQRDETPIFIGYDGSDMSGLNTHGEEIAVYKLRRVSTMKIIRKIER